MKHHLVRFIQLPARYKLLFLINFVLCGVARASVLIFSFARLKSYLGEFQKMLVLSTVVTPTQRRQAAIIGRSIRLAAKYTPWNSNCLAQALVAKFWCKLYKLPYVLYIGFTKSDSKESGYQGHAWLAVGPVAVTGGQGLLHYTVVSTYVYWGTPRKLGLHRTVIRDK